MNNPTPRLRSERSLLGVATGPQDAEISRCIEPVGSRRAVHEGCRGIAGSIGAAVPARDRYEEDGEEGLGDRRLGRPSPKKVPAAERSRMLKLYRETYWGWNVKHFHEHLTRDHGFRWDYTWGEDGAAHRGVGGAGRGAYRRKRERKPGLLAGGVACQPADARPDRDDG
jgi:hypothetical protein